MRRIALGLVAFLAQTASAQTVQGVLVSSADSVPIPYGTIIGPDGSGRFADAKAHFTLGDLRDGTYHVQARMIGYSALDTTITLGPTRTDLVLRIAPVPYRLATVPVTARRGAACVQTGIPTEKNNPQLAAVFDQLETNIERYDILLDKYPFYYRRVETQHITTTGQDGDADTVVSVDTARYDSRDRRPYRVGSILYQDRTVDGQTRLMMYLPTFADLGDSAFDAAHCFTYMGRDKDGIRVDFRPADNIVDSDVEGSVYLDADRYLVRRAVFRLTKPKHAGPTVLGLTATTTFEEVLPFVPILAVTRTSQPMNITRNVGVDKYTVETESYRYNYHPLVTHHGVEVDSVLDHTFVTQELATGSATAPGSASAAPPVSISLSCSMPPSFETTDVPIYGTVAGVEPGNPNNDRLTLGIRRQFKLPDNLTLDVYGFAVNSKVAPTLTGAVTFQLNRGRVSSLVVSATSLIPAVDSALVTAVRRADSVQAFVGVPRGRYTISLSSAQPDPGTLSIDLAHIAVPVEPLARKAAIEVKAAPPMLPAGSGVFQFVVDEHGRAIPTTLVTVKSSSPAFATAVGQGLDKLQFDPALSGTCPIKQVVRQPFQAMNRAQEQ